MSYSKKISSIDYLEYFGRDVPTWSHPDIADRVVHRDRPQQQDVDPASLEDADLTDLRQTSKFRETFGEFDKTQDGDRRLIDELIEGWIELADMNEWLQVNCK